MIAVSVLFAESLHESVHPTENAMPGNHLYFFLGLGELASLLYRGFELLE
jgi:hypothetical protein